jgi:glycosyltransferase involved in cell wall biosynthesis
MGPLNGNIHYPPAFRNREPRSYRYRRLFHIPGQIFHRLFFRGRQRAQALLVAGGSRTERSLRWAGCRRRQFVETLDSGVLDRLLQAPRIEHHGANLDFIYNGRLVAHKGVDLILRALLLTKNPVRLTIVGRGPAKPGLEKLAAELQLGERVRFIEWIEDHSKVSEFLRTFRAFVFPSLAEANGIVVQEAMAVGLPVICVKWGGPALLVTPQSGIAIEPKNEEYVITELAKAMDELALDAGRAEQMSQTGRDIANERGFGWQALSKKWTALYGRLLRQKRPGSSASLACSGAAQVPSKIPTASP